MARMRHTIRNMPLRGGLVTAGQRGTVAENEIWYAKNISSGMDGMLQKRPGLKQWGQQLMGKSTDVFSSSTAFIHEYLDNTDDFVITYTGAGVDSDYYTYSTKYGLLRLGVTSEAEDDELMTMTRSPTEGEGSLGDTDYSVRFGIKLRKPYDSDNAATSGGAFILRLQGAAFKFDYNAVYYHTGAAWTSWYTSMNTGQNNAVEIQVDADGNTALYLNGTSVATVATASVGTDAALAAGECFEFSVYGGSVAWNVDVWDFLFRDAVNGTDTAPFMGKRIQAITDFQTVLTSGALVRNLVVATKSTIYIDRNLMNRWTSALPTVADETTFTAFRDKLIIFNSDGNTNYAIKEWDGSGEITPLDDAPPVRFGTSHRTRLWAAGNRKHPLRLYYTASRQSNVWFEPDVDSNETYNEVTEAGFIEIPGNSGDEITSLHGEMQGSLIVSTNKRWCRVVGTGPTSFAVEVIAPKIGLAGPYCVEAMGNDLWGLGNQGVGSLQLSMQYGDLESAMPSGPIQDLWEASPNAGVRLNQDAMHLGSLAYNDALGLMYAAVPELGEPDISAIYVYNANTQKWLGPWTGDTCTLASVEIAQPVLQTVMHGTTDGRLGFPDQTILADFEDEEEYEYRLISPLMSGRSVDPSHVGATKTWDVLRLFVQPRGDWEFDITTYTDDNNPKTVTKNQNVYKSTTLSDKLRLDVKPDGYMHSMHTMAMIEVQLDARGMWFGFEIDTTGAGEELIIQGYEVEYTTGKPERE